MDKWQIESDPSVLSCHYIAKKNTVLSRISGVCNVNVNTLRLGMLVEVNEVQADGGLRIRVNDTNDEDVWRKTEWRCHKIDLIKVPELVWQFLAAVAVPGERVDIASDEKLCREVANLKQGVNVWYRPHPEGEKSLAIVKYIGPRPELGQGFYFGLQLLDDRELPSSSTFTAPYGGNSSGNLTVATLSHVRPFEYELSDRATSSHPTKSISVENVRSLNEYYSDEPPKSLSSSQIANGKRTQPDLSVAFDERLNIFDDRNNNSDGASHMSNALIPKVAHKSTKSKILVNDANTVNPRNHDSFDFFGNNYKL